MGLKIYQNQVNKMASDVDCKQNEAVCSKNITLSTNTVT